MRFRITRRHCYRKWKFLLLPRVRRLDNGDIEFVWLEWAYVRYFYGGSEIVETANDRA